MKAVLMFLGLLAAAVVLSAWAVSPRGRDRFLSNLGVRNGDLSEERKRARDYGEDATELQGEAA